MQKWVCLQGLLCGCGRSEPKVEGRLQLDTRVGRLIRHFVSGFTPGISEEDDFAIVINELERRWYC